MPSNQQRIKVLHYVWWNNAHLTRLLELERASGVNAHQSRGIIPTSVLRILLSPLYPLGYRLLGYQILHLHWVAGHFKPSASQGKWIAHFYYLWFRLYLQIAKLVRLKVVWTAHNVVPHDPVFPNDVLARKYLVQHIDKVFALNETSRQKIITDFESKNVMLIPVAEVIPQPSESGQATRERLGISMNDKLFSHFGHLRKYKGTELFIEAMAGHGDHIKFLIAGAPGATDFMARIHSAKDQAKRNGVPLIYQEGFLLESELANLMQASDFIVCPFENINNSGFVNIAFSLGIPVILSDVEGLSWVPRDAAIWIQPNYDSASLSAVIDRASAMRKEELVAIVQNAKAFAQLNSWDAYVTAQVNAYNELILKS